MLAIDGTLKVVRAKLDSMRSFFLDYTFSPGMGTMPWIINSEIYPLSFRGIGGGIAAVSNRSSNLIFSETFLTLTENLSTAGRFLFFVELSFLGLTDIFFLVPETKGLQFEEVEKLLQRGYSPFSKDNSNRESSDHTNN